MTTIRNPQFAIRKFMIGIIAAAANFVSADQKQPAGKPPVIPVGFEAFRQWERWPYLRIGQRTCMTSTYDRRGGNEGADASHFLYQLADDKSVSLDVQGPGVLVFKRTNHWHGSPWHYIVDGTDHIVQESSTADPDHRKENSVFIPEAQFPNPLTWTWSITKGADLTWVPIPFEKSFTLAYGRTHYGTGYYIYQKFLSGIDWLSSPIKSWNMDIPPDDVLELLRNTGTDPKIACSFTSFNGTVPGLAAGEIDSFPVYQQSIDKPMVVRKLQLVIDRANCLAFNDARLQLYWDGQTLPSVNAPIPLLFGAGTLYNRDDKEFLVKAFPVNIRFTTDKVYLSMYFPMPFFKEMRMAIVAGKQPLTPFSWEVVQSPLKAAPNEVGYFHATYVDHGEPKPGRELVFLDTRKVEGGGDWGGHFVGTSFIFTHRAELRTLEGDPRFYFDDSQSPQAQGTGTEEWGGGGDYWGGRTMSLPFAGHPVGCVKPEDAKNDEDKIHSAYRFLLTDLFPFGKNARITFEHGGENNTPEHYKSVAYWYGNNKPYLVQTDSFDVGNETDEKAHAYESPDASPIQTLSSRYEWGVDHLGKKEIFPESTDTGRFTETSSTFTLAIDPNSIGVMLRRKMDYSFPNQCARVFVLDEQGKEHEAGTWYTAGANMVIYSNPKPETGPAERNIQTSNRRWREDEFLLPIGLTQGKSKVRVRVQFTPKNIPLFPGHPLPKQAWSEYHYWAYCFVLPK